MNAPARRHYLMCQPRHFEVSYSINPWMDPTKPVDRALALAQWDQLRSVHESLGHVVHRIEPVAGLADMVYTANGGTVLGGRALAPRFRHRERAGEARHFARWFRDHGWTTRRAYEINEGEGDFLPVGGRLLAGTGFRSTPAAHREAQRYFGRPVVGLTLIDPRFYHLDTALTMLDRATVAYFPGAFDADSREILRRLFPDALLATEEDAVRFGLNAVSDGHTVVLPDTAVELMDRLDGRGFRPIGVDLSELHRGGGGPKCCTLVLHDAPRVVAARRPSGDRSPR